MRRLLLALQLTALAAVAFSQASHLYCSCRDNQPQQSLTTHCYSRQENDATVNCTTASVVEVPPGYLYLAGYALVTLLRVHQSWADAAEVCKARGDRLAVPPDEIAVAGLRQLLQKEPAINSAYVGVRRTGAAGRYVDTEGNPVSALRGDAGDDGCCALQQSGTARCAPCDALHAFFCERRLSPAVPADYRWFPEAGRFYKVHEDLKTYPLAAETCRDENGGLAVPDTWLRAETIASMLKGVQQQYFVGLTDTASEGDFVTQNGRHMRDMEFQNWNLGEPNNGGSKGPENCVTIKAVGILNDYICGVALPFICEILPV